MPVLKLAGHAVSPPPELRRIIYQQVRQQKDLSKDGSNFDMEVRVQGYPYTLIQKRDEVGCDTNYSFKE